MPDRIHADLECVLDAGHRRQQLALAQAAMQKAEDVVGPAPCICQGGAFARLELEPTASAQRRDYGLARTVVEPVQSLA
jgi:hypothetical protein